MIHVVQLTKVEDYPQIICLWVVLPVEKDGEVKGLSPAHDQVLRAGGPLELVCDVELIGVVLLGVLSDVEVNLLHFQGLCVVGVRGCNR